MKSKKIIRFVIIILLAIGLYGVGGLVYTEIQTGNGCPKLWIIPACYIIFLCFLIPLIVHLLKKYNSVYFIFTGIAVSIATIASIMQYTGNGQCPKLDNGTPMCYLSFLIFATLITLKKIQLSLK